MRHFLLSLALLASAKALFSQLPCPPATANLVLSGNEIRARIRANGNLFSDGLFQYNVNPNIGVNPSTIYRANLWFGGVDPAFNLKLSASDYGAGFSAGPLDNNGMTSSGVCDNWDRVFRVYGSDVAAFFANLPVLATDPTAAIAQYKDIMGWPGWGNPYFLEVWGFDLPASITPLAPFFDKNQDGVYNPLQG